MPSDSERLKAVEKADATLKATKLDGYKKIIALVVSGVVVPLLASWGVSENITLGFMTLVLGYFGCQSWVDKTKAAKGTK